MSPNIYSILILLISLAAGGLITWYVSRRYYKKAADELKDETTKLREQMHQILIAIQHPGPIKLTKDADGIVHVELIIKVPFLETKRKVFSPTITSSPTEEK